MIPRLLCQKLRNGTDLPAHLTLLDEHVLQIQSCTCTCLREAWRAEQSWQRRLVTKEYLAKDVVNVINEAL